MNTTPTLIKSYQLKELKNFNATHGGGGRCAVGVVAFGCARKGHMEYAEGWELRGLVRVADAQ